MCGGAPGLVIVILLTVLTCGSCHEEPAVKYRGNFIKPCFLSDKGREDGTCSKEKGNCNEERHKKEPLKLVRLDGIKTGYTREVDLGELDRNFTLITRAMKPLLFEIPHFLSDEECDHLIDLAKKNKFEASIDGFDKRRYQGDLNKALDTATESPPTPNFKYFSHLIFWDRNSDNFVDLKEIEYICAKFAYLFFKEKEIKTMFDKIGFHGYKQGGIHAVDFPALDIPKLMAYLHYTKNKDPRYRTRYSETTWLEHNHRREDPVLRRLEKRVTKLTKLPRKIIRQGESLQVVHYGRHGHYHAHYDSMPVDHDQSKPCCHHLVDKSGGCQVCRFITILYYLNDVTEGGETAFPVADNATFDKQALRRESSDNSDNDEYNLSINCHRANLVAKPKKGQAIMWYNHFVDDVTGLLGNLDDYSVHGGCDVIQGEKWIANNWILASPPRTEHLTSLYDLDLDVKRLKNLKLIP